MQKWEYRIELVTDYPINVDLEETMNELGNQGWEVFRVVDRERSVELWVKRPSQTRGNNDPKPDLLLHPGLGKGGAEVDGDKSAQTRF